MYAACLHHQTLNSVSRVVHFILFEKVAKFEGRQNLKNICAECVDARRTDFGQGLKVRRIHAKVLHECAITTAQQNFGHWRERYSGTYSMDLFTLFL